MENQKDASLVDFCTQFLDVIAVDIIVILHQLVDVTLGTQLYDAVGNRLDELVVVRSEEDVALELLQVPFLPIPCNGQ